MRALAALLVLAVCHPAAAADSVPGPPRSGGLPFYVGGTQVHERNHERWTEALRQVGMNTVAVTVYAKQGPWDGDHLWYEDTEPAVVDEIRAAKARGLAVVLVLRVALDHGFAENKFLWHGMIMPRTHEAIRGWFANYTRFVVKWAAIAEAEGVDVLGIGSEMNALTATLPITRYGNWKNYYGYYWYQRAQRDRARRFADEIQARHLWVRGYENYDKLRAFLDARFERTVAWARQAYLRDETRALSKINERRRLINDAWIELIRQARGAYGGKLTYAANFDSYRNVGFWRNLDLIGINAYFPLRPNLEEAPDAVGRLHELTRAWTAILEGIENFEDDQDLDGMPFLFTELGYTFRRHSTVEPWAHGGFSIVGWKGHRQQLVVWGEQPVDYDERRRALEALRAAHRSLDSGLTGILYWKLSTDRGHETIEPYVLHVGPDSSDRALDALVRFASPAAPGS